MAKSLILSLSIALLLAGCATGPDYHRPDVAAPGHFLRAGADLAPLPDATDDAFWQRFDDPTLSALVTDALGANHDLRAAVARYDAANALLRENGFDRFPTVTATGAAVQQRLSTDKAVGFPRSQRSYQAGIQASWELDLFGRVRRSIEASRADTAATAHDVAALQVAIVAETARTYMQLRGAQARLRIALDNVARQQETLDLVRASLDAGRGTPFDTSRAEAQRDTAQATIPMLERDIALAEHRLAVLTGRAPEALVAKLDKPAPLPAVPESIAAGTPADLLRRRPDVAAAEERLHAATANIGVATADLFPKLSLGAMFGGQTSKGGSLVSAASMASAVVLGIDWSFLDVGRVRARIDASRADARGMLETYQGTVLHALEETENALVDFQHSREQDDSLARAARGREEAARIARDRYRAGAIDLLELLDAERDLLSAQDAYAQSHTRSASSAVALYQALAGGWPQAGALSLAESSSP
jgi:NodT family efflux transporter outer membrane factor (OMF) lipoprotein